jgi:hypothetical protein
MGVLSGLITVSLVISVITPLNVNLRRSSLFSAAKFLNTLCGYNEANMHGFNCAYLGLKKENPYLVGSIDHQQFEWGWNEGIQLVEDFENTPICYPGYMYRDNEHV